MKKAPAPEGARHQTRSDLSTPASYADRLEAIRAALLEHGIEPANPDALLSRLADAEGRPVRFGTASKPRSKNGWLIAYHDRGLPFVVIAGDWAAGAEMKWTAHNPDTL